MKRDNRYERQVSSNTLSSEIQYRTVNSRINVNRINQNVKNISRVLYFFMKRLATIKEYQRKKEERLLRVRYHTPFNNDNCH